MTRNRPAFLFSIVLLLVVLAEAAGQSRQDGDSLLLKGFLVEGGRLNVVDGDVQRIDSSGATTALKSNQTIESGDLIQSGASGRAEILLHPGYYLRLDHNTRISLLDLSPDNLKLKLWTGAAILEVASSEIAAMMDRVKNWRAMSYEPVSFLTPGAEYLTASGGCFRLKVDASGNSELRVVKGFAFVNGSRIEAGKSVSVSEGRLELTSASESVEDPFESWSRQRAKGLVKANQSLSKAHWYKQVRSDRAYVLIKDPEDAERAKERLTVSADTGVTVLVENAVVSGTADSAWRKLKSGERLTNGDRVRTAVESRAEIHVYANCFLFLEGDTEIVYRETEGQIVVDLIKGSAIAILEPDREAAELAVLTLAANKVEHKISERGNYRLNVTAGVKPELLVYEETTRVPHREMKKSRSTSQLQDEMPLKKLTGDSFDVWSYRRSKLRVIRGFNRFFGPSGGMWYLLESTGEHTFVPAVWEYSSPYGGTYSIRFAQNDSFLRSRRNRRVDPLDKPGRNRPLDPLDPDPKPMRP